MIKIPLVGAAYQMQAKSIDTQNCINWYPQAIEYPNGTRVKALMPTAGLKKIFQGDNAAVRALFVLSNGNLLAVIGKKLYHTAAKVFNLQYVGEISGLSQVSIADNGLVAMLVNGTYTYSLDLTTLTLTKLTGSNIPRSTSVAFLDGRFILNKIGTGRFVWTALYSTDIDPLSFATAEASPDPITAIVVFNRELWMFGSQTVERYYSAGNNDLPYARLSGGTMPFGCVAPNSISRFTGGFIWLAVSEFGGNQIVVSDGGSPSRVSIHAIEEDIGTYARTDDAIAYAYQFEGHVFYVISFPTANVTWCYDASTGLWHQRSWTNEQGFHERHRSQCHAFFRNMHIVGDHRNGKLYALDKNTYTDDGDLITRERTCPAVITDGAHVRYNRLEIVCETAPIIQPPIVPSIHVEFQDGVTIADLKSVVIKGTTEDLVQGDNIELTISADGVTSVLTNVIVQANLTFTTLALDLSAFAFVSSISVTATKLNSSSVGFISDSAMANIPALPMQLRIDGSLYSGWTDLDVLVDGGGTVTVDWGDGSAVETGNNLSHTYSVSALCTAQVTASAGAINYVKFTSGSVPEIINFGNTVKAPNLRFALDTLVAVPAALPSYITSLDSFFQWCTLLNSPNLSSWNTVNVISMNRTFNRCDYLNQPLPWNTSNCEYFESTFDNAYVYNQFVPWNTSKARVTRQMFNQCGLLNQSFSHFDMSNVGIDDPINNARYMYQGCTSLVQDFTMWCVPYIDSTAGSYVFASSGMTDHPELQPVWGTCPA